MVALFVSQSESRAVPPLARSCFSSFQTQRTDMFEPLSNHINFKSTVRPRGISNIQVQTEAGRVLSDGWFVGLSLLGSVKSPGKVRLMWPAGSWSKLIFPPQWWCDKANVLSEERKKKMLVKEGISLAQIPWPLHDVVYGYKLWVVQNMWYFSFLDRLM